MALSSKNKPQLKPFWILGTSVITSHTSTNKSGSKGDINASQSQSQPDLNKLLLKRNSKSELNRRRRKANNILIETEETEQENDFVIISTTSTSLNKSFTNSSKASVSNGTQYESSKLQNELDTMKRMRQNHGDDWLLSTPNLVIKSTQEVKLNYIEDVFKTKSSIDKNILPIDKTLSKDLEDIIESFVVYRFIEDNDEPNDKMKKTVTTDKKMCILSLSTKSLIEKDESNTIIFNLNEYSDIENGYLCIRNE